MRLIRTLQPIIAALTLLAILAAPVFAYLYRAQVSITENGTANYTPMLAVSWNSSNTWMAANGFMRTDARDTRVQTLGGLNRPWMVSNNQTFTAVTVPQNSQTNLYFVTGESVVSDMDIIVGYSGNITVTDNASLEPYSANFTFSASGYFDTSTAGATKTVVEKTDAFRTWVPAAGVVLSRIESYTNQVEQAVNNANVSVYGLNWYAQTFTAGANFDIARAQAYTQKVLAPLGNITVSIRPTVATVPTGNGTDIVSYNVSASTLGAAAAWNSFDYGAGSALVNGTQYALIIGVPSGTITDYIRWYLQAGTDPYAGGGAYSSADGGDSWIVYGGGLNDFEFRIQSAPQVSAAVASGVHTILTTANITFLALTVDGVVADTEALGGATVPLNANDWVLMRDNVMPYASNITLSVNGTQQLWYDPVTIVQGNVLPNRASAGVNVGQIAWGSNPTGVSVTLGSFVSSGQPVIGGATSTPTTNLLPPAGGTSWNTEPAVTGALLTHPLRSLVVAVSDNTSLTERQTWVWSGIMFVALVLVLAAKTVRGHQGITAVATGGAIVACVVQTIFPLWALVLAIPAILGGIVSERTPSL